MYYFLLLMNVDPMSSVEKPGINNYSSNGVVTSVPGIVKQLRSTFYLILVSSKSRSKADFVVTSVPGIVN